MRRCLPILLTILCWSAMAGAQKARAAPKPKLSEAQRTALNEQLVEAADDGRLAAVRALLAKGADPNAADKYGTTALMHACESPDPVLAQVLMNAGADVNRVDSGGWTALMTAAEAGNADVIELL